MTGKSLIFTPPWWLKNRHLQSCFNKIFPPAAKAALNWEQLELPDGDFIDLCWAGSEHYPIVVLLHGLEGSINSHYIQLMLDALVNNGWQTVVMHFRTCSGRLNRLSRSYHAGEVSDFSYLMQVLRTRYPAHPISVVGFSLGGNVLLHYLVQQPNAPVRRAVAVSIPFDLNQCVNHLPSFYQWNLLHSMKQKTMAKIKGGYPMPVNLKELRPIHDFRHFDEAVTAPLHGFSGAQDYYEKVTIRYLLKQICHETLIIHAYDDPLVPASCIPCASELSSSTQLELHPCGGHVGFVTGLPWRVEYWLKKRILNFLKQPQA